MGLSVGIVGLPNVGKSTIFNALTRAQHAEASNYPFCTIEPNKAVVPVPDERLDRLAELAGSQKIIHATVDFVDIAGLVKGASQGEGLGNKFLSNIRETDAILQVVRCFDDDNVVHVDGSIDPVRDIEIIEAELIIADFQMMENRLGRVQKAARGDKAAAAMLPVFERLTAHLGEGRMAHAFPERETDIGEGIFREMQLLTDKKVIYCCNVDEDGLQEDNAHVEAVKAYAASRAAEVVKICAKMEEDLNGMSDEERDEFLREYGVQESGLDKIIHTGYRTLGLISYLTQGPKEARAWTIHRGDRAPRAAGVIHTDFERGFIRAQVISYEDFIGKGGEAACRDAGLLRTEGKEYVVQDGDVIEFLFNV
jgi:GTP-binding protein YchF